MVTTAHHEQTCIGKLVEHVNSFDDSTNNNVEESSIVTEKSATCGLELETNDSQGIADSNKETSNFSLEPLTNDSEGVDESNKESCNDSSKDKTRSMDLFDRFVE